MKSLLFSFLITLTLSASAATLNDVTLPDQITVDGKALNLNGLGLRTVVKFGFTVKVYVGALYLENKSSDTDEILNSQGIKRMVLHFVRPVDREAFIETFSASYENTCVKNCAKQREQFSKLIPNFVSVRKDNEIIITYYPDKVELESTGPNAKKQIFQDADISYNLLSVFIHKEKSPGKDFRAGLLGLAAEKKK